MPKIRVERAGKKASRLNKFKVLVDDAPVGVLPKWGDGLEIEVTPGTHTLEVTAFGGVRGSADVEVSDGESLQLQCGYPSMLGSQLKWMTGGDALAFWEPEA
jgi:hypothetical protein